MKRILFFSAFLFVSLFLILLTPSAMAQSGPFDASPVATVEAAPIDIVTPPSQGNQGTIAPDNTLTYVAYGVLVLVLIFALLNQQRIINLVAKMVTPETARDLFQLGISAGGEAALNNLALKTDTDTDDQLVIKPLQAAGYKVTRLPDDTYHVEPPTRATVVKAEGVGAPSASAGEFRIPHRED